MSTAESNPLTVNAPSGLPFIESFRDFDAPVAAVFRAHSDPELIRQWLGPRRLTMEIESYDVRTGGRYRYIHRDPDGAEFVFNGVFHAVIPQERIVQTFEFEGWPGVVSLDTLTFTDLGGGRTRLTGESVFPTVAARDTMVSTDMEEGMTQGYQRLDDLLTRI